ncbi:helix-turn-helix transcriptional regulator [Streptomyces sp. MS06]|uniref:helix-turn-helix transcriptional regulator n=1 Tax=Streptomyces sp. MS06 TaxID=3385974 RepID=UPI0039A2AFC7
MLITSPAVIGRGAELAEFDASLAAAREGDGRAVFLLGEAGIGKSRLAAECAFRAFTRGLAVLRGRSGAGSGAAAPFRPVAEALLSFVRLGGLPDDAELAPYRSALAGLLPEWRTAEHNGAPASTVETAEAMLRLLGTIGRDLTQHPQPGCLLVLEDLHDADTETLALVDYLCDNIRGLPILLLATLRPGPGSAEQTARQIAQRRSAVLSEPRPLTDEEVRAMAEAALAATGPAPHDAAVRLPDEVAGRLARDADGNPFVVEELLNGMITADVLRRGPDGGWHVSGDLDIDVPRTVVHSVSQRSARLSPDGRSLLNSAAVLGRRFSLAVLQAVSGLPDRDLLVHLRAGMEAHLISPSGPVGDWYEFRHALTAEALVAALVPAERAAIAARGADAIERAHPGLPGEWCVLVADLRQAAGDLRAAAECFAQAGRSALDGGAVNSAVSLFERALDLLPGPDRAADRAALVEQLVYTLAENGQLDRACALADELPEAGPGAPDPARAAALQARIARACVIAARLEDAAARVRQVRRLLRLVPDSAGPTAAAELGPAVELVEAHLVLSGVRDSGGDGDRTHEAERLARQAADGAERAGLPEIACEAWQLLAVLARRHGFEESDSYLEKCLVLATEHRLTGLQLDTLMWLGVNDFMYTGSSTRLERAHRAALGHGALALMYRAEAAMAMQKVLRGDYTGARDLADRCAEGTARLRDADNHQFVLLTRVALAAHQGRRRRMERELAEFSAWGGEQSLQSPQAFGSRAICALLEEDHDRALRELDEAFAWEERNPSVHYLNGRYGLRPLLRALSGRTDPAEHAAIAADPAAALPWNRQFERLAYAVHEGRAGRGAQAEAAVAQALEAGEPFLMARRLGQRLVAPTAMADGWGDPVGWLREAEEYFHDAGVPAVANSCRDLLRQAGATVHQRRHGTSAVPAPLRRQGLTAREYEVFLLLAPRLGNQEIAERLYISPRTVEKHVAKLLAKTGRPHRSALCDYATEVTAQLR